MRQQVSECRSESTQCAPAARPNAGSGLHRGNRWHAALDALLGAPMRLHRYRHLHAEVIEDALRAFDCGPDRRGRT